MARIRTIKPDFFIDDEVAALQPLTRILFVGLWCLADKAGRLEDRPHKIKIQVLPYDKHDIDAALNDLVASGFIFRYEAEGKKLIQIRSFDKNQRPHHTEKESELPSYNGELTVKQPLEQREKPVGKEGKGKEGKGKDTGNGLFEEFWKVYPKKKSKESARKAFLKIDPHVLPTIIAAVERNKLTDDWLKDGGRYIPFPATWLNNKRWEDEATEVHPLSGVVSDNTIKTIAAGRRWLNKHEEQEKILIPDGDNVGDP